MLDAEGGEDSSCWDALVPALAQATGLQIITYDRAGLGDSDAVEGSWDPVAAAADLQAGLQELGVTSDAVLVSHSQAGRSRPTPRGRTRTCSPLDDPALVVEEVGKMVATVG